MKIFLPPWIQTPPPEKSYRSIFKWGNPAAFKHPSPRLFRMLKQNFGLDNADFRERQFTGETRVVGMDLAPQLSEDFMNAVEQAVGKDQVERDVYSRLRYSTGQTTEESMDLRQHRVRGLTDLVVHPRHRNDVQALVTLCHAHGVPLSVYGGGSSVTLGHRMDKGGITLVMGTHMNRIHSLNETDLCVTVEAGMMGAEYEKILNEAPSRMGAVRAYTGGHFPQSFEYSSVGGWVLTLGSGQASSHYGDAADLLLAVEMVTPRGTIRTSSIAATATGPRIQDFFKGSEGAFGVLVSVTMKIFRFMPQNRQSFSFIFHDWSCAVTAAREISQADGGMPAVLRISDEEETDVALKLYGVESGPLDHWMRWMGFKPMARCLMLGTAEGERIHAREVAAMVRRIARQQGGMSLTAYPVRKWEHSRYMDPYMREDLLDFGIIIDTLETGVPWSRLHEVHRNVRAFIKQNPEIICMSHASHFYPQGTNLYFIFISRMMNTEAYRTFHRTIIRRILDAGGTLSHHHGVGRMMAPFMEEQLGKESMDLLKAVKRHLDPKGIMGPGIMGL
ncbi:FAD-binding protein [Desulfobotulus sp. H1]|uniref:FAD-binding protein n=1 Tax=Desulfobotulus pelophilus TaxID=2823377 RepID=A0ABT3N8B7_9BACT|nr:FAD-linked oxidase C-terminal domain-containing protein [Desulfobotulus pelophilus]MCW7753700.1 FAD-binding protein [Desulfobotulus pelophilus]